MGEEWGGDCLTLHNVVGAYFPCGVFQEFCNKDLNCYQLFCSSSKSNAVLRKAMKRAKFILDIHAKDLIRLKSRHFFF